MEIIKGSAKKPVSTERLIEIFERQFSNEQGVLYVGYPVLSTPEDAVSVDALMISKRHGVVAFHLVEGKEAGPFGEIQDDIGSLLETKLKPYKTLRKGRTLLASPTTITYAPLINSTRDDEDHILVNDSNIVSEVNGIEWGYPDLYEAVLSVIQSISTIRRNRRRRTNNRSNSHGAALQVLEDSIANLDSRQSKACLLYTSPSPRD